MNTNVIKDLLDEPIAQPRFNTCNLTMINNCYGGLPNIFDYYMNVNRRVRKEYHTYQRYILMRAIKKLGPDLIIHFIGDGRVYLHNVPESDEYIYKEDVCIEDMVNRFANTLPKIIEESDPNVKIVILLDKLFIDGQADVFKIYADTCNRYRDKLYKSNIYIASMIDVVFPDSMMDKHIGYIRESREIGCCNNCMEMSLYNVPDYAPANKDISTSGFDFTLECPKFDEAFQFNKFAIYHCPYDKMEKILI